MRKGSTYAVCGNCGKKGAWLHGSEVYRGRFCPAYVGCRYCHKRVTLDRYEMSDAAWRRFRRNWQTETAARIGKGLTYEEAWGEEMVEEVPE